VGGVAVVEVVVVEAVLDLALPVKSFSDSAGSEGTVGSCFFCAPKEKVRPAFLSDQLELDLGTGGTGMSLKGFLFPFLISS